MKHQFFPSIVLIDRLIVLTSEIESNCTYWLKLGLIQHLNIERGTCVCTLETSGMPKRLLRHRTAFVNRPHIQISTDLPRTPYAYPTPIIEVKWSQCAYSRSLIGIWESRYSKIDCSTDLCFFELTTEPICDQSRWLQCYETGFLDVAFTGCRPVSLPERLFRSRELNYIIDIDRQGKSLSYYDHPPA